MTEQQQILADLLATVAALRDPQSGCPWDLAQTYKSIVPNTLEEAYEVADAIEQGSMQELHEELGDLLLQVIFYSQLAREEGHFDFYRVMETLNKKLIRRHPHVFGEQNAQNVDDVKVLWEQVKSQEREDKGQVSKTLDTVTLALPALVRAQKLQKRAAKVGFDWKDEGDIFAKIREEIDELEEAYQQGQADHVREELGDVFFSVVNLARRLEVDSESALRQTNTKFVNRFHLMEELANADGKAFAELSLEAMETYWQQAKQQLKAVE